jgi:hypothetical protein
VTADQLGEGVGVARDVGLEQVAVPRGAFLVIDAGKARLVDHGAQRTGATAGRGQPLYTSISATPPE